MRILLAIVHFWNPEGGGGHSSLRKDPAPRIQALQQQLLAFQRLGLRQAQLNMAEMRADQANQDVQHEIDIKIITDGKHHLLDKVDEIYKGLFQMVISEPKTPMHLGFEAQAFLGSRLKENYDLYGYMEDDLIINDPWFFNKIDWFRRETGDNCLLLPHRMELPSYPTGLDRFYIDGPMLEEHVRYIIPNPPESISAQWPGGEVTFESPSNPHAGCFFLSHSQLSFWRAQSYWQDKESVWVSPLESAATLGIAKTFRLFKTNIRQASWLELQHWGRSFHCLLGKEIHLPKHVEELPSYIKPNSEETQ